MEYKTKYVDINKLSSCAAGNTNDENFNISVNFLSGKNIIISTEPNETFATFRQKISNKIHMPICKIRLLRDMYELTYNDKMYNNDNITLVLISLQMTIAAGINFAAAIAVDGTQIKFWTHDDKYIPKITTILGPNETYTIISASTQHIAAITSTGNAHCYCWHNNDPIIFDIPTLGISEKFEMISAGHYYTAAITTNNRLICWGVLDNIQKYANINENFVMVYAGACYMAAIKYDGSIVYWHIGFDELIEFKSNETFIMLSISSDNIIAITSNGNIRIIFMKDTNYNILNSLDIDTTILNNTFSKISISNYNIIGIIEHGHIKVLGDGADKIPTIDEYEEFIEVLCGYSYFSIAKTSNNNVLCWSYKKYDELPEMQWKIDITSPIGSYPSSTSN